MPAMAHRPEHPLADQVVEPIDRVRQEDELRVLLRLEGIGRGRGPRGLLLPGLGQRDRGVGRNSLLGFVTAPLEHGFLHLIFAGFLQPDLVVDLPLTKRHVLVLLHLLQHRVDCALDAGLKASAELLAPAGGLCVGAVSLEGALCDQASDDASYSEWADTWLLVEGTQMVLRERQDARPRGP